MVECGEFANNVLVSPRSSEAIGQEVRQGLQGLQTSRTDNLTSRDRERVLELIDAFADARCREIQTGNHPVNRLRLPSHQDVKL